MPQTRSATRKQREREMNSLKTDGNGQAGGSSALEGSLPCSQEAGHLSAISIGGPDIAAFGSLEEFLNQTPYHQQQTQQEQQEQQQQLVVYDPLNQPYLPWDCPGSDQQLYPFPISAMAENQHYLSSSYFVEPNYFGNDYTQQQYHQQLDEYRAMQSWVSPSLDQAAIMDVRGIQGQAGELLYTHGDGSYEPLPFEYPVMPDHLVQDSLLDARWAATYEGDLFGHSQALDGTNPNDAVALDENAEANSQLASPAQPLTAISPNTQEQQQQLPGKKRPARSHPKIPFVLAGTKAEVEKARRRRLAGRRRKGPKPVVEVDWLPHGADRETKDRFLVEARGLEVSYKMIKIHGRFKEAESTLRGRFRTLTKSKEDRVRDPQWTPIDIQLLKEAVQVYAGSQHPDKAGISWMMVSQYIKNHGGTYSFGYNTCHRRWLYLESTGQLGDNVFDQSWETYDEDEKEAVDDEMEGVEAEAEDEPKVEDDDEADEGNYVEEK
ncbi:hypothetical protein TGAM01_v201269 [Trichoderma gamsii]|uniref:Myb-like domain-containing protein n=1 Tax=Trichoderma gamsii TaxID=398673 RepID=A0A2P5A058_9HYPO|nr:hypothetical protein TGAM01_v201269 [Trichoderma gamsii]PON29903.1 hypothetical protein TGAM01_v201269 [Trichoderma gamsii]